MVTLVIVYDFDLLVIGSGPGGQKAAIAAAKLDRHVGIIEKPNMMGGVCVNTGTIPSKTLREAVLYLTGLDQREMYGQSYRMKDEITIADLSARTQHVVSRENDVVRSQLARNRVSIVTGTARFAGPNAIDVDDGAGRMRGISADNIVIATGTTPASTLQPIGIYSLPEISFIGKTEDQLTQECVPFEVGVSRYRELARGQIIGDSYGVLKLLVSPEDRTLLGVHVFGTGATELVHIGQAVMGCGGTVDYLVDAVFNYPTLAESYKVAALDATNKMRQVERFAG